MATWATVEDLYARYGGEFMDKISTRRQWDSVLNDYVADETVEGREEVIQLALDDAKALLTYKISCVFGNVALLETDTFMIIKSWHVRLAIEALKLGGDCMSCVECNEKFDAFLKCGMICTTDGVCLPTNNTFISVSNNKIECGCYSDGCCSCK